MFRAYLAVVSARYRMLLQYRTAAIAGFVTQFFWGTIKLMVLGAFYAVATTEPPMSFTQIVAYVWLGQALLGMLPWNIDNELQEKFDTGSVAYELLRPVDLYMFWFSRMLAFRTAPTSLRMIPMLVVALWVLPLIGLEEWALQPPPTLASGVMFAFSLVGAVLLTTAISTLIHITLFWTIQGRGIAQTMAGITPIFAGLIVPLPLFPEWAQGVIYWQPFRGIADVPFRIYSGNIVPSEAVVEVFMQLGWVAIIMIAGYALLGRARVRLVVQGG